LGIASIDRHVIAKVLTNTARFYSGPHLCDKVAVGKDVADVVSEVDGQMFHEDGACMCKM
jgi:hypothetical protein